MKRLLAVVVIALLSIGVVGPAYAAKAKATKFQTEFGYVTVAPTKLPKPNTCTNMKITLDIRNMTKVTGWGMTIKLLSDFDNLVGYEEFEGFPAGTTTLKPAGIYVVNLPICRKPHVWTHSSGNRHQDIETVKAGEDYTLEFAQWYSKYPLGDGSPSLIQK